MAQTTQEKMIKAIEVLTDKIISGTNPDDALKFTQAALNVANLIHAIKDFGDTF